MSTPKIKLHRIFSDHIVLQQNRPVYIGGRSDADGKEVSDVVCVI